MASSSSEVQVKVSMPPYEDLILKHLEEIESRLQRAEQSLAGMTTAGQKTSQSLDKIATEVHATAIAVKALGEGLDCMRTQIGILISAKQYKE